MLPYDWLVLSLSVGAAFLAFGVGLFMASTRTGRFTSGLIGVGTLLGVSAVANSKLIIGECLGLVAIAVLGGLTYTVIRGTGWLRRSPRWSGVVAVLVGFGVIAAGAKFYDQFCDDYGQFESLMDQVGETPELEPSQDEWRTDRGGKLTLNLPKSAKPSDVLALREKTLLEGFAWEGGVIHRQKADERTNCHGWVFADGKGWILGRDVALILRDNDYRQVETAQPGDIAIYRGDDQSIRHTALVRSVGAVTMVESKWGWMGVYLHEATQSCYGTKIEYYRTTRPTHVCLHGKALESHMATGGAE